MTYETRARPGGDVRVEAIGMVRRQCVLAFPRRARGHRPLGMYEAAWHTHPDHVIHGGTCCENPYGFAELEHEESWHYRRECVTCGRVWWGLHCPHDGAQNPCPECGRRPEPVPDPDCACACEFDPYTVGVSCSGG